MRVVLDTNVVVSGLLSPGGPPGRILDLLVAGRIQPLYDDRITAEYRAVLARPRLRIAPPEAAAVVDLIEAEGVPIAAEPLAVELSDADDLPFLEVAISGVAEALVTGNERHYRPLRGAHTAPVLAPAAFLARYLEHPRGP